MEEAGDLSNPITTTTTAITKNPSTAAQRKHAEMLERLSKRSITRQEPESTSTASPMDSTQSFLSRFSQSKWSIESQLSRIHQTPDPHATPGLKSDLESVSISISDLEQLVAESSYFLPPYELRICLNSISELKQNLENVSSQVVPKKKFSFKNKPVKKAQPDNHNYQNSSPDNEHLVEGTKGGQLMVSKLSNCEVDRQNNQSYRFYESPGLRGKENEVLMKEFKDGLEEIGEFSLSDLSNCEVRIMGRGLRALFMNKLRNCKVYVGPVTGSILIEDVEASVFVLASHQIRIHHAKECDFYLRVRSRPIIEDSNGVRFAPYCLRYDGIYKDLEGANLAEETGNWGNVDDFRWLRAVQSPNWSILPESERLQLVDISRT